MSRRWIPPALALVLLAGSALAFAYTERLKVEPSPIAGTLVDKIFSPVCACPTRTAAISFRLRKPARVTVDILDSRNHSIRTLVRGDRRPVGRVTYRWNGLDSAGRLVAEAGYRPRVRLAEHGRTIVLPNTIRVDVTRPVIRLVSVRPRVFSPNGDRRNGRITAVYEMTERAQPALLANGRPRVVGRFKRRAGKLEWRGDGAGPALHQGIVRISLQATDLAGNLSRPTRSVPVVVRFIRLARRRVEVPAAGRFAIGVVTDMRAYRWRFAGKSGFAQGGVLRLTAPVEPGPLPRLRHRAGRPCRQRPGDRAGGAVNEPPLVVYPHGAAPVLVLGVRRSGTTLLRVILDRSSELAIPDESYVVPQLASRHRGAVDPSSFVDDLRRLPRLHELGIAPDEVARRLRPGMTAGEAIAAVFETYAAVRGKPRWGDKNPLYMQHLPLLESLFPDARFVHLVRDGSDAAVSFLSMPEGIVTRTWVHPRDVSGFACQWRTEVEAAQALGARVGERRYLEIRYERLVSDPAQVVQAVCGLPGSPTSLRCSTTQAPSTSPASRTNSAWRSLPRSVCATGGPSLAPGDTAAFEEVAGDVLGRLGYEVRGAVRPPSAAAAANYCRPASPRRLQDTGQPRNSGRRSGADATRPSTSGVPRVTAATLRPRNGARSPFGEK